MRSTWNSGRSPSQRANATYVLIGVLAVAFLLTWLPGVGAQFNAAVAYNPRGFQFWQLFTYPLDVAGTGAIGFLFLCWWLYILGTFLEGSLGSYGLMLAFWGSALLASVLMTVGAALGIRMAVVPGIGLPVAALTVLWGARNQSSIVHLFLLIPIAGKWL
ncbi:MAG TPA: hypothetical protein VNI20_01595, partial [Fimbriimonadaceae bacterium]|nr:hypothetical protein [Fimbriimonadaceae bacterium]